MDTRAQIAVVLDSHVQLQRRLARHITTEVRRLNLPWVLNYFWGGPWNAQIQGRNCAGAIVAPGLVAGVASATVPIVHVAGGSEYLPGDPDSTWVQTDSYALGALGARHLSELGFHRLAYCGGSHPRQVPSSLLIAKGIEQACHDAKYPFWTFSWQPDATDPERSLGQLESWLSAVGPPLGVLAQDDAIGRYLVRACARAGLQVPKDVAVLGIGNDELMCEIADVALSSIEHHVELLAQHAVEGLQRMLSPRKPASSGRVNVLPRGVVTRHTTSLDQGGSVPLERALRYIREHASRDISVSDVVKAAGTSRTTLKRLFARHLEHGINEEIQSVRLARAEELLLNSDMPIKQVAAATGFNSLNHFNYVLRQKHGVTPGTFRKRGQA